MTATANEAAFGDILLAESLIIANPAAAANSTEVVSQIEQRLAGNSISVRTVWTEAPGHAAQLVSAYPHAGLIVAVGGDGTVAEVVDAMAGSADREQVLMALPAGSGNSTSRNLWGDLSWEQVLDLFDRPGECRIRHVDLLHLVEPDSTVLLGASTGFLAEVLIGARHVDPALRGIDRYYAAAVDVLQAMPADPTRVTVDGAVMHDGPASSVTVGGGRFRARSFAFLPDSLLSDGLLDVSTIAALDSAAVAEVMPLMPTGEHLSRPEVRYSRGRRVVIERTDSEALVAEFDGDVWDAAGSRLAIEIVPEALRVLAPVTAPCG
jgi:diacylglycerol kinase (ATP)